MASFELINDTQAELINGGWGSYTPKAPKHPMSYHKPAGPTITVYAGNKLFQTAIVSENFVLGGGIKVTQTGSIG